jgi:hypothetical protein
MKIQMFIALTLAGCSLVTTSTTPRTSGQQAATQPTAGAPLTAPERPEPPAQPSSIIGRVQLTSLKGLSPEAAKQMLATFGHKGEVTVSLVASSGSTDFAAGCADNTVCGTNGGSGIGFEDPLVLYINPTLTIAPP